jgi:hypothetical protein
VTVTNANICSATATSTITVNGLPSFSIGVSESTGVAANDGTICYGTGVTLTSSGGSTYSWSNAQNTAGITVNPTATTTYSVTVTTGSICSSTSSVTITVTPQFTPVVSVTENSGASVNDGAICAGSGVSVALSGGNAYLWSDGSTSASRELKPACTTTYNLTTTDAFSCMSPSNFTITVGYQPQISQVTPLTGNAGSLIHIYGTNLDNITGIRFNGQSGTGMNILDATHATAMLPAGMSIQQVEVLSPCGDASVLTNAPTVSSVSPQEGNVGTLVTLTGTYLDELVSVTVGGIPAVIISQTPTTARIIVMPGSVTGAITVSTSAVTVTAGTGFTVNPTPYPYFQQSAKYSNSINNGQQGTSVSVSADGNTAIIGSPGDNNGIGAAWIYVKSGSAWIQQSKLVGTGAVGASRQGTSVALSSDGNTAVAGGTGDNSNTGAIWVFVRSGDVWTQQGNKLVGTGAVGQAQQGSSVALSGDGNVVATGGLADDSYAGAVWMFRRYGTSWAQSGNKFIGNGATGKARQGASVALNEDGTRLISGGYQDNNRLGAAWIFYESGVCGGITPQVSKLVGTGGSSQAWQGFSVSLSADGNTALVGGCNDNALTGAAWLYTYNGSAWIQQARLSGTAAAGTSRQGSSVALSADGNTVLVGGMGDDSNRGAMWVFRKGSGVWTQQGAKIKGSNATGAAKQGSSVSLSENGASAVIGGPADAGNKGAFWVFVPNTALAPENGEDRMPENTYTVSDGFHVGQNIPNPTGGQTVIPFYLPEGCMAEWEITDAAGRVISAFAREYPAGDNLESFDLTSYEGILYYRLKTPFGCQSRNMLIVK